MPRKLNPQYLRRVMSKDELRGAEKLLLFGFQFGVSDAYEGPSDVDDECISIRVGNTVYFFGGYRGWTKPSKLYCIKCWSQLSGIPREIVARNWCDNCSEPLHKGDTDEWLDRCGFALFRSNVDRYTGISVRLYRHAISGGGDLRAGFHLDHMLSVRQGFEDDIPERVVASPVNLSVISVSANLSKGSKSTLSKDELLASYAAFVAGSPKWLESCERSDKAQPTYTIEDLPEEHWPNM